MLIAANKIFKQKQFVCLKDGKYIIKRIPWFHVFMSPHIFQIIRIVQQVKFNHQCKFRHEDQMQLVFYLKDVNGEYINVDLEFMLENFEKIQQKEL